MMSGGFHRFPGLLALLAHPVGRGRAHGGGVGGRVRLGGAEWGGREGMDMDTEEKFELALQKRCRSGPSCARAWHPVRTSESDGPTLLL